MPNLILTPEAIRKQRDAEVQAHTRESTGMLTRDSNEKRALYRMQRFNNAVMRFQVEVPAVRKLLRTLDELVTAYVASKGRRAADLSFDVPELHQDATVRFGVNLAGDFIIMPRAQLRKEIGAMLVGIAHQVANEYADRKLNPKLIDFKDIKISSEGEITFRIFHGKKPIKPKDQHIL